MLYLLTSGGRCTIHSWHGSGVRVFHRSRRMFLKIQVVQMDPMVQQTEINLSQQCRMQLQAEKPTALPGYGRSPKELMRLTKTSIN